MTPAPAAAAPPEPVTSDIRGAARGGLVTLAGAGVSTAMGFVLALVLARQYGATGAGIVQQAIAVFTIALAVARVGMDTTAVWLLPRLRVDHGASMRGACVALLGWPLGCGTVIAGAWFGLDAIVTGDIVGDPRVDDAISAVAWAMPFGAITLVALAATRGFGGVVPFNLIGNIALPSARPVVVVLVAALGGSALGAAFGWAVVLVPACLAAVLALLARLRRHERRTGDGGSWSPSRAVRRQVLRFGLPRAAATVLEQSIIWMDVVLVGIIAGPAAAGVYGVASRFVSGGMVVLTALRIVVAPLFSARLAAREYAEAQSLYTVTSTWIVLFGTPLYVLLACFSPTVLGLLGDDFVRGSTAMVVLCIGGTAMLAGGNIQSLLLMSGHSGWGATNKLIVFATNVALNLILVPLWGILGAAVAWAVCMALDATLAAVQVRRFTGVTPAARRLGIVLIAAVACAGAPSLLVIAVLGQGAAAMVLGVVVAGTLVLTVAVVCRRRLQLDALSGMVRRGRGAGG